MLLEDGAEDEAAVHELVHGHGEREDVGLHVVVLTVENLEGSGLDAGG